LPAARSPGKPEFLGMAGEFSAYAERNPKKKEKSF